MLAIAFITLAVLLVLFGICAFVLFNGNRADGEDMPEEEEEIITAADEEERPRRRKRERPALEPEKQETAASEPEPEKAADGELTPETVYADEPKPVEPQPDEPKPDEPKPDEPKPDEPKPDEPQPEYSDIADSEEENEEDKALNLVPIIAIAAAVLVALAAAAIILVSRDAKRHEAELVTEPKTITASIDSIREETEFAGVVECTNPEVRYFAASGSVEAVKVKEGDRIKKGQTVYVLDSSSVEERIALLKERLKNATTTVETTVDDELTLKSATAGTVSAVYVSVGDKIKKGDELAAISASAECRVKLSFDAAAVGEVSVGDAAAVSVGGSSVSGTVTSVGKTEVENPDGGAAATLNVTISFRTDAANLSGVSASIGGVRSLSSETAASAGKTAVIIKADSDGRLTKLNIKEGDRISEGAVIGTAVSSRTVSETKTDELEAKDLQLQIKQLENELENYTVKAASNGYVRKLYVKEGENAAVNMQAAEIIPDGSLFLSISVAEAQAEGISIPAPASFKINRSSEFPSEVWDGVDTSVKHSAVMDRLEPSEENGVYKGRMDIENQDGLRAGMTAAVNVTTYSSFDALLLPRELVKDGKVSVWRANRIEEVGVETGIVTDDGFVEILSGITSVDKIVADNLKPTGE